MPVWGLNGLHFRLSSHQEQVDVPVKFAWCTRNYHVPQIAMYDALWIFWGVDLATSKRNITGMHWSKRTGKKASNHFTSLDNPDNWVNPPRYTFASENFSGKKNLSAFCKMLHTISSTYTCVLFYCGKMKGEIPQNPPGWVSSVFLTTQNMTLPWSNLFTTMGHHHFILEMIQFIEFYLVIPFVYLLLSISY